VKLLGKLFGGEFEPASNCQTVRMADAWKQAVCVICGSTKRRRIGSHMRLANTAKDAPPPLREFKRRAILK
jgi:hypothetical protein